MKGTSAMIWGIVVIVVIILGAVGAYYLLGGSNDSNISNSRESGDSIATISDIITKNLGYKCTIGLEIRYPSDMNIDVNTAMYLYGKKLRIETEMMSAKWIYIDPDITNENTPIYDWTNLTGEKNAIKIPNAEIGEKIKKYLTSKMIYNKKNWNKPLDVLLNETLHSTLWEDLDEYMYRGIIKEVWTYTQCEPWTPDDNYFKVLS